MGVIVDLQVWGYGGVQLGRPPSEGGYAVPAPDVLLLLAGGGAGVRDRRRRRARARYLWGRRAPGPAGAAATTTAAIAVRHHGVSCNKNQIVCITSLRLQFEL